MVTHHRGLIRSKTRMPATGVNVISRPRLAEALRRTAAERSVLVVTAPAGSGKTTAVVQLVQNRPGPAGWLTLGEAERTPGRLAAYLAAAAEAIDPALAASTLRLLDDGLAPEDCAATLAERLPAGSTLVLDDVHQVEVRAAALRVLRALVDALAPGALLVLVSRRLTHLDLARDILSGRVGILPEGELTFREDEIASLLAAHGVDADPRAVAEVSRGWAAGIVFDILRVRGEPIGDGGGPGDAFFEYIGAEILDRLPADVREAVLWSAPLDLVTPERLSALGASPDGEDMFARICREHLPGTREPDGFRYHPRFREYLLDRLHRRPPAERSALLRRCGLAFAAEGLLEDAADCLLAAGDTEPAADAVEAAAPTLLRRGDWDKLLGWCTALGEPVIAQRSALRGLQLRALLMSRRQDDVAPLVERLRATGEFARHLVDAPDVAAWAAWALHGAGDLQPLLALTPPAGASRRAHAVRYILEVCAGTDPPPEWKDADFDRVLPLHVALQSAVYYRGRLGEVERLAWAAAGRGPVTATLAEIYRIAALIVRRDLAEARAALEATAPRVRASRFIEFWQQVEAELRFAEGDHEGALRLIRDARATSRQHGYRLAERGVFAVIEGKMLVRMGRVPEAVEQLEHARNWCAQRGIACFREWADTWLAAALLHLGEDPSRVGALLDSAIAGMERADRRLELVAAHIFRAEAHWRAGDERAHDVAADAAFREAVAMGTLGPLISALGDMPDVLVRRIDASTPDDDTWRAIGRATRSPGDPVWSPDPPVVIATMGREAILVDGRPLPVSPPRAIELAATIARAGADGAARTALIDDLAGHSADPANYLRQLLHRLRRALPPGTTITSRNGRLAWESPHDVVTEDTLMEGLILRARREVDATRGETLARALAIADQGAYLPQSDTAGARRRRDELAPLIAEARREYVLWLLQTGRFEDAVGTARAAVEGDPYREDGWRLLMRAHAAADGPVAVVPVFLECVERLADVGLAPSPETRDLLERLRG